MRSWSADIALLLLTKQVPAALPMMSHGSIPVPVAAVASISFTAFLPPMLLGPLAGVISFFHIFLLCLHYIAAPHVRTALAGGGAGGSEISSMRPRKFKAQCDFRNAEACATA